MTNRNDDITQTLKSAHGGDDDALQQLIYDHLPWIEARVRKRLGTGLRLDGETHDFVQEAIIEVLRCGPKFSVDSADDFRALVARIVENTLIDRRRYMLRDRRDRRREQELPSGAVPILGSGKSLTSPASHAARSEQQAWLRLPLELLAPDDREAIRLRDWEELGFGEAGERLGITEEAMRKRYHRALPKLAKKLDLLQRVGWQQSVDA